MIPHDSLQARDVYLNLLGRAYPELKMVVCDYLLPGILLLSGERIVFAPRKNSGRLAVSWLSRSLEPTLVGDVYNADSTLNIETLIRLQADHITIVSGAKRINAVLRAAGFQ